MSSFADCAADPAIVAAAQAGERSAHAALYGMFAAAVYTLAFRILQSRAAADEVVQDTFVEVIRNISRFDGRGPCGAWIRRIAVNKSLMQLRSPWRRRVNWPGAFEREPAVPGSDVPAGLDLERALAQLSERARAVLWLHDVEGYTHQEIGRLLGRTASFSKSTLARAHSRLRILLGEPEETLPCTHALTSC
jgi:RNA polymerase sigma-70 factor (ECF subfamily)